MVTSAAPVPVAQQHIVALLVLLLAAHTARHAFSGDIVKHKARLRSIAVIAHLLVSDCLSPALCRGSCRRSSGRCALAGRSMQRQHHTALSASRGS